MNVRAHHALERTWRSKYDGTVFSECGCGWRSPTCGREAWAWSWWEWHVRQMIKQHDGQQLRDQFRQVLALHGRVALDDLEEVLDELVAAAVSPSPDPGVHVSTRIPQGAQNAAQAPIR